MKEEGWVGNVGSGATNCVRQVTMYKEVTFYNSITGVESIVTKCALLRHSNLI